MRSTFHGLETARRGMTTQQSALYVTGHNISNANTPGYSRQRVNFTQTEPYPPASTNSPMMPGQMGTGVQAGSIERVREAFLDLQYRGENTKAGYWGAKASALTSLEDIMNEPSEVGLSKAMDEMWNKMQDVATNPQNSGARDVAITQAQAVGDTFKYISDSLTGIRSNLESEISLANDSINTLIVQINSLNKQIAETEPHGYLPNDLYDERDRLVDELSGFVKIEVIAKPSGGQALAIAAGKYTINMVDNAGNVVANLIDGTTLQENKLEVAKNTEGFVEKVTVGGTDISFSSLSEGKLKGLIEAYGYDKNIDPNVSENAGLYPEMLDQLDRLAYAFVKEFNEIHRQGYDLNGTTGNDFFDETNFPDLTGTGPNYTEYRNAAQNIKLAITKGSEIAAGASANQGSNGNAYNLADVIKKDFSQFATDDAIPSKLNMTGDLKTYYSGMIGTLGVNARETNIRKENAEFTKAAIENNRQSVSAVSLDEEMTNLIKFQHAYNAAARNITVIDEMLEKIINGMGTVGR